ncbi:MAG: hypothetical protein GWN62_33325 [Aliifodinibius sp.]|nr:hypothetical protein [Fodinibius sp.]
MRFIEVDEYQHFSHIRLNRLQTIRSTSWRPVYPIHFWENILTRRVNKPYRDLDPPHRDEQRAYLDELRDRLPVLYGLKRTIRIDEFTLKEIGLKVVNELISD